MPLRNLRATWSVYRRHRAAGFVHVLDCGPRDPSAAILNHCSVLWLPEENLRAWAIDIQAESASNTYLELATRYADGTLVGSLNHTTPSIFDRPPWIQAELHPGLPAAELLALHRSRVAAIARTPIAPWDEDPLTTAARENQAVLAYQAERGILAPKGGDYRYTGRGAVRSVQRLARAESD